MTEKSYKAMCEEKLEELDNLMSKLALLFSKSLGRDKNSVFSKRHENQMYLIFYTYRMAEVTKRSIQFHIDCEDKKVTFLNRISIETDLVIEVCNVFFPIAAEEDSKPQLCKLIDNLSDNLNKQGVDLSDEEKAIVKIREYIDSKITKYLKLEEKHKWVSVQGYESNNPLMEAKGLRDNMAAHRDSVSKFCKKMEYLEIQAVADNSKEYGEWMISLLKLITYLFAESDKTSKQYLRSIGYF